MNAHLYALHDPILALWSPEIFHRIQTHLAQSGIQIIDTLIFGNSTKNPHSIHHQTLLKTITFLQSKPAPAHEPISPILELTARVLTDLHENPSLDIYIIIADTPELIPLLRVIKHKNKLSYLISLETRPDDILVQYADIHQSLEELLGKG